MSSEQKWGISALVIRRKEEAEHERQPQSCLSAASLAAPSEPRGKVVPPGGAAGWARGVSRLFSPGCSHPRTARVCACVFECVLLIDASI